MADETLSIEGLQQLQDLNVRLIAALKPQGGLGRAIQFATVAAHRYLLSIIHVASGAYKASNVMEITGSRGRIFVSPSARNPRSGAMVADYAPIEEARGGEHAAYGRVEREQGSQIRSRAIQYLQKELPL